MPENSRTRAFHVAVALFDGLHHRHDRYVVGQEPVRIDGDLVLFDEAAEARHLGNARHALKGQLQVVVLKGAQLRKVMPSPFSSTRA